MASKKPVSKKGMSAAFIDRAKKEREKLRNVLAIQLHADMLRMFKEEEFSDITLACGVDKFAVHLPLIQARLPDLYASCVKLRGPKNDTEEHQEVNIGKLGLSPEDAKELMQLLYTSDNVRSHWKDIQKHSIKSQAVQDQNCQTSPSEPDQDQPNTNSVSEEENSEEPITNNVCEEGQDNQPITNNACGEDQDCQAITNNIEKLGVKEDETALKQEDTMKWRKTDPKCNDPSLTENTQLTNGVTSDLQCQDNLSEPTNVSNDNSTTSHPTLPDLDLDSLPAPANLIGRDLLNMFTSGCGHDVKIKVEDKEIPAHKFLLCNRSNYFAAMLGGGWRESNSAEITLEGVSYSAVIASLCFIYGATPELPVDVNIREIVYLADMYCLEGLKEVAALKLRQDNCHYFHKPCSGCLAGVPEAVMLSHCYRITDLHESSVRWVLKYLDRTWAQRSFAAMPSEVIHQCSEFAVTDLSCETAITMTIQVDKLVQSLPQVKWSEPVHKEAQWLLDACIQYIAMNFLAMIEQESFEKLLVSYQTIAFQLFLESGQREGRFPTGLGWNKGLLESLFDRIICNLSEKTAIPAYLAVNRLRLKASLDDWNMDALELVNRLIGMCHNYMVSNVNFLTRSPLWARIPEELQRKIKEDAVFVDDEKRALAPKPKLSSSQKSGQRPDSARGASGSSASSTGQRSASRQGKGAKPTGKWKP